MIWSTFFHVFLFDREVGGSKAIWAMPIWNQHISKRASLTWSRNDDMAIYLCSLDFDVDSPDVAWEEKLGNNKNRII